LPIGSWIDYDIGSVTIPIDNGITISFWAKFDGTPVARDTFNFKGPVYPENFNISIGSNSFGLIIWQSSGVLYNLGSSSLNITSGTWYNFVVSIDTSKNVYIYQNGTLVLSGNYSGIISGVLAKFGFQLGGPVSTTAVQTEYADVRIYTGAAQAAMVPTVMAATASLF
jgi:hypothetical protein